jgi:hypothetical protein
MKWRNETRISERGEKGDKMTIKVMGSKTSILMKGLLHENE